MMGQYNVFSGVAYTYVGGTFRIAIGLLYIKYFGYIHVYSIKQISQLKYL